MSITILSVSLPPVTAQTEETEPFPYTIYSRYSTSISSAQLCVNGNLHANAGVSFQSSNMNLNGAVTSENETDGKIEPVYADQRIIETFFPEQTVYNTDSYSCEDTNVAVNQTVFSYEEIELNGNTNLNASIGAYDNIEINGNCFTSNQVVLYSGFGNVTITVDSSVSLNGLIYAPFGTVTLSAPNVSVNGIIIAENVLIQSGNANINKNDYFARFIGTVSDGYDFSQIPEKYNGDSDDDELPDIYEKIIGTDPMNFDTDGDALPDGYEVIHLGTDPLFVDTDDNGISDPDEDFDEDGLCNLDEYLNETDPYDPDSDMDGYTDGDEVELYLTDPANPDSDDDGLLDGDEGADGFIYTTYGILFDPLLPDTDGNGISDGAEQFAQTYTYYEEDEDSAVRAVSIDMVAAGVLQNHTNIENILDMDVMCSGVVGLIGAPYDIETLDVTGTATLRFTVDPDKLEDTQLSDLMFLWYDEENDEFVELETAIDEDTNTVSTVVSHFSKYMIVNRIKWFEAWQKEFNYTTSSYDRPICHTVLAIDCSASMLSNDPGSGIGTYRYLAVCNFIDSMDENDKAAIVKYNSNASVLCSLTDNKTQLKEKAKAISSSSGTSFDSALLTSVSELKNNIIAPNTRNYIILLSDGESSVSENTWTELAKCSNLVIHTVCLRMKNATTASEIQTQKNAEKTLADIADRGHGNPYIAKTAEDLNKLYTQVGLGISIDPTDNDADGLPDILEIVGIRCSNGVTVTSDPTKWDTDGDGVKDGDEIITTTLRIKSFNFPATVYQTSKYPVFFTMKSDPNKIDSDEDGITDPNEYRNVTTDSRFDSVAPLSFNTLESFYPELHMIERQERISLVSQPVTIKLTQNTIHFLINYSVNDFATETSVIPNPAGGNYTHEEIIVQSIMDKWDNQHFTGTKYDFYPGLEIHTNVLLLKVNNVTGARVRSVPFNVFDDSQNSTAAANWEVHSLRKVHLGTKNSFGGDADALNRFAAPAHELGHVLGISDVYGYSAAAKFDKRFQATVFDINQTTNNEIWYETRNVSGDTNPTGDIMKSFGVLRANNLEAILQAFCQNEYQYFTPRTNGDKTNEKVINPVSSVCKQNPTVFLDRINKDFTIISQTDGSQTIIGGKAAYKNWLEVNYGIIVSNADLERVYGKSNMNP